MKSKKIIISCVIVVIVILILVVFSLLNNRTENKVAILNVATESRGSWINTGTRHYFTVYSNGAVEKTEKFTATETETYDLYTIEELLNGDNSNTDDIPIYSNEIIKIINNLDNSLVGKYFIVNGRYFFSTTISETPAKDYSSSLFEYFPDDNKFERLANFKDVYIVDIGLVSK